MINESHYLTSIDTVFKTMPHLVVRSVQLEHGFPKKKRDFLVRHSPAVVGRKRLGERCYCWSLLQLKLLRLLLLPLRLAEQSDGPVRETTSSRRSTR